MLIRQGRWKSRFGFSQGQNTGVVKLAVLLSLAAFLIIMIFTVDVQQTKAADCNCGVCHGSNHHGDNWTGCSTCHDSPPQTGTHLTHYNSATINALQYGDTAITSTDDAYKFGCGNCHPLDNAKHRDGILQVELYNAASPADSIKAKNPAEATYTPGSVITEYDHKIPNEPKFSYSNGTCSNVYCHSGYVVISSGTVGNPLTTADNPAYFPPNYKVNNGFIMDETCSSLQYAPYTVNSGREYLTTPAWGTSGNFSVCSECHQFPMWSDYTTVQAGVGDSHYWINEYGYAYGHENNMEYFPGIGCATCHNGTANHRPGSVANPPTAYPTAWQNIDGVWLQVYYPVTLKSRVMHVNGNPDVSFDTLNGYRYYYPGYLDLPLPLTTALYDPATKTCSDVACHYGPPLNYNQKEVKWGSPYRGWEGPSNECDQCHRYGYLNNECTTP
jgi:predicted CxxxxCH...CXXCH cytochrome family protein